MRSLALLWLGTLVQFSSLASAEIILVPAQPAYYYVPVHQGPVYYRPLPVQPTTIGQRYYSQGARTDFHAEGNLRVDQRYQTEAKHQCEHGPFGSRCGNSVEANRDYLLTQNGAELANGEIHHKLGATRNYAHAGSPYDVSAVQAQESSFGEINRLTSFGLQLNNEIVVEMKAKREALLANRTAANSAETDRKLAQLDEYELKRLNILERMKKEYLRLGR